VPEIGSYQLRVRARQWAAARLLPEQFGERVEHRGVARVHVYQVHVPDNGRLTAAPVIDGSALELVEGDDQANPELMLTSGLRRACLALNTRLFHALRCDDGSEGIGCWRTDVPLTRTVTREAVLDALA
jgi:hypothetical protein